MWMQEKSMSLSAGFKLLCCSWTEINTQQLAASLISSNAGFPRWLRSNIKLKDQRVQLGDALLRHSSWFMCLLSSPQRL